MENENESCCGANPQPCNGEPVYVPMPQLGQDAPYFKATTTQGTISFPGDYAGKWVVLFSHPGDFTPVCTSEFITFASMEADFKAMNCQLIGLSVDSNFSHIAWIKSIHDHIEFKGLKNIEVNFPVIEDTSMEIAKKYGMIQPYMSGTSAVRAVFLIDPSGKIRAMIYYPMVVGRNMLEIRRALLALQTADKYSVALPADWYPGDDVLVRTPNTIAGIEKNLENKDISCSDWYFCMKKLPKEKLMEGLRK